MIVASRFKTPVPVRRHGEGRHGENRAAPTLKAQDARRFETVKYRHVDIHQDNVIRPPPCAGLFGPLNGFSSICRQIDRRAGGGPDDYGYVFMDTAEGPCMGTYNFVDITGTAAAYTGLDCVPYAGHVTGSGLSAQANMVEKPDVWLAMQVAFETTEGELADRLLEAFYETGAFPAAVPATTR